MSGFDVLKDYVHDALSTGRLQGRIGWINHEKNRGVIYVDGGGSYSFHLSDALPSKAKKVSSGQEDISDDDENNDATVAAAAATVKMVYENVRSDDESVSTAVTEDENEKDFGIELKSSDNVTFSVQKNRARYVVIQKFGPEHKPEEFIGFLERMGAGDYVSLVYQDLCKAIVQYMSTNIFKLSNDLCVKCIEYLIGFYEHTVGQHSYSNNGLQLWKPLLEDDVQSFVSSLGTFIRDNGSEWKQANINRLFSLATTLFRVHPCNELGELFMTIGNDYDSTNLHVLDAIVSMSECDYRYDPTSTIPWNMLPLTPTQNELTGNPDIGEHSMESDEYFETLPAMKSGCPYDNLSEYLETNFRLYRADCFVDFVRDVNSTIKKSLNENSKLTRVPLFVKPKFSVVPVKLDSNPNKIVSVSYIVSCIPASQRILDKSLCINNVIAISLNGKFDDVIWAQIVDTDETSIQNADKKLSQGGKDMRVKDVKKEIRFEISLITESNGGPEREIEIIKKLLLAKSDTALIIENSVMYRAYEGIFNKLKGMIPQSLCFKDELVFCKQVEPSEEILTEEAELKDFLESNPYCKTLDEGQRKAFLYFARNRFSLIQGPPGTGKSYLGTRIALALNEACKYKKVLVVSYKNHSLDEFILDITKITDKKVVRFGRSPKRDSRIYKFSIENLIDDAISNLTGKDDDFDAICRADIRISNEIKSLVTRISVICSSLENPEVSYEQFLTVYGKDKVEKFFREMPVYKDYKNLKEAYEKWAQPFNDDMKKSVFADEPDSRYSLESDNSNDYSGDDDNIDDDDEYEYGNDDEYDNDEYNRLINEGRSGKLDYGSSGVRSRSKYKSISHIKMESMFKFLSKQYPFKKKVDLDDGMEPEKYIGYVMQNMCEQNMKALIYLLKQYRRAKLIKRNILDERQAYLIKDVDYICCTVTGASAFHSIIARVKPDAVVIEEACEVPEPSFLGTLFPSLKRLVMIGDPKQLRPPVASMKLKDKKLNVSCFERLKENGYECPMLTIQNRMLDPVLWPVSQNYPGLVTNTVVNEAKFLDDEGERKAYELIRKTPVFWWAYTKEESKSPYSKSYHNPKEAKMVSILVTNLVNSGFSQTSITVLTPYLSQVGCIEKTLRVDFPKVKVTTIDSFQGDENKIIILSLVRSHEFTEKDIEDGYEFDNDSGYTPFKRRKKNNLIGFMNESNRLVVATSRHKLAFFIIGNETTYSTHKEWNKVIEEFRKRGSLSDTVKFFCPVHKVEYVASDGTKGCGRDCNMPIPGCMHKCKSKCHSLISRDVHPLCKELVDVLLDCGHTIKVECCYSHKSSKPKCSNKKEVTLPCGHKCWVYCSGKAPGKYLEPGPCNEICKHEYKCKHMCARPCSHCKRDGSEQHREDDCLVCKGISTAKNSGVDFSSNEFPKEVYLRLFMESVTKKEFKCLVPCVGKLLLEKNIDLEEAPMYYKYVHLAIDEIGVSLPASCRGYPNLWCFLVLSHLLDKQTINDFIVTFRDITKGCNSKSYEEYYDSVKKGILIVEHRIANRVKKEESLFKSPFAEKFISDFTEQLGAQSLTCSSEDEYLIRCGWHMPQPVVGACSSFTGAFGTSPIQEIEYKSVYDKQYSGCLVMSVRLKDPIFAVLTYCAPNILMYSRNWSYFIHTFVEREKRLNPFQIPEGYDKFAAMKKRILERIAPERVRALQAHVMRLVSRAIVKRYHLLGLGDAASPKFDKRYIKEVFLSSPDELVLVCNKGYDDKHKYVYQVVFEAVEIYLDKLKTLLTYDFFILRHQKLKGLGSRREIPQPYPLDDCVDGPVDDNWKVFSSPPPSKSEPDTFFYRETVKQGTCDFYAVDSWKKPCFLEPGIPEDHLVNAMLKILEFDKEDRIDDCLKANDKKKSNIVRSRNNNSNSSSNDSKSGGGGGGGNRGGKKGGKKRGGKKK